MNFKKKITSRGILWLCSLSLSFTSMATTGNTELKILFPQDFNDHLISCCGKPVAGKIKTITQKWDSGWRQVFDFDKEGRVLKITDFDGQKEAIYKHFKYNKQGHVVKKEYMDNGNKSTVTITPDSQGNPLKRVTKEDGYKEEVIFTYDFNKREVVTTLAREDFHQRTYSFDEQGRVYRCEDHPSRQTKITTHYTYNQDNQVTETKTVIEREHSVETRTTAYTFNVHGLWAKVETTTSTLIQEKDENGNVKDEKTSNKQGMIEYTDYQLDAMGNVTKYTEVRNGKSKSSTRTITRTIAYF